MSDSDYFKNYGDFLSVDIWYPKCEGRPKFVELGLVDVRAVPDIRLSFDFERNGWVIEAQVLIEQDGCLMQPVNELGDCIEVWKEIEFIDPCVLIQEAP